MEKLLNIKEVAELIGLSRATIYSYVSNKSIPHIKLGTRTLFSKSELENWITKRAVKTISERVNLK